MSIYNLQTSHPVIPNANQYFPQKKYISIHSEDRDIIKHPDAANFYIELPQDYLNILSIRLVSWAFPSISNVFSKINHNVSFVFQITNPFPVDGEDAIYQGLMAMKNTDLVFMIEEGNYTPIQLATELTNKLNSTVTNHLRVYFKTYQNPPGVYPYSNAVATTYTRFTVVYNDVSQKLSFGNSADAFAFNNSSLLYERDTNCSKQPITPSYSNWGLPSFLGFTRCDESSYVLDEHNGELYSSTYVPRLSYKTSQTSSMGSSGTDFSVDNGYWILPAGGAVQVIDAPFKVNLTGNNPWFYLDINELNCIDETSPYNLSAFTMHTNTTNGVVNAAFAVIPTTTTVSQVYDADATAYKWYLPPLPRLRKISVCLRYHNGQLVQFGTHNYSIMLELSLANPQIGRQSTVFGISTNGV